jgi:hypothetical protein
MSIHNLSVPVSEVFASEKRIIGMQTGQALFRYTDTKTGKKKTMKLKPFEFIRWFSFALPINLIF